MANEFDGFDITVARGSTKRIRATIVIDGVPQNISAWTQFWFYAKEFLSDLDADAIINKTLTGGGIMVVDAPGGVVEIDLLAADTTALSNHLHWYYAELKGVDGSGQFWNARQGTIKVVPNVIEAIV